MKKLHRSLWKFYVFCGVQKDGKKDKELLEEIQKFCVKVFKNRNSLNKFLNEKKPPSLTKVLKNTSNLKGEVFISYSRKDSRIASEFSKKIMNWGFQAFIDVQKRGTNTWPEEINKKLKNSDLLIVLWSKNSKKSKWVEAEITYFQNEKKEFFKSINNSIYFSHGSSIFKRSDKCKYFKSRRKKCSSCSIFRRK